MAVKLLRGESCPLTLMKPVFWLNVRGKEPAAASLVSRVVDGLARVQQQVRTVSHGLIPVEVDAEVAVHEIDRARWIRRRR